MCLCIYVCMCIYIYVCICIYKYVHHKHAQSSPTLCDPMDCSPPGSSVHGILQARILEWAVNPFFRVLRNPGIEFESLMSTCVGKQVLYHQHHLEALGCTSRGKQTWVTEWDVHLGWPGWSTRVGTSPRKVKKFMFPRVSGKAQRWEHCAS